MNLDIEVALLKQSIKRIKEDLRETVSADEFEPVKKIVYGLVTMVLVSVAGAIIAIVIK